MARTHDDNRKALWQRVEQCREKIWQNESNKLLPQLRDAWRTLVSYYKKVDPESPRRLEVFADTDEDDHPFEVLMLYVRFGYYPPPALLLALVETLDEYLHSDGSSLESTFFGTPIQSKGNYAKRKRKETERDLRQLAFEEILALGLSREDAAERISYALGGSPSSDWLLKDFSNVEAPSLQKPGLYSPETVLNILLRDQMPEELPE